MSLRIENISLNCKKAYFQTIIENLHVGDVKSTQLVFTLTDGIKEIELPDGKTTAIIHGKKPDGTEIHNVCTVENNKIYYTLTAQDTAVSGIVDYMLDVTVNRDEQYERAYMPTFRTRVSDRIYSPAYRELETEPDNWETEYKNYYRKEGNAYIQIGDNVCPTFAPGTFYVLVDPPVESASQFLAFFSAFNKVSELFDKRLVIDSTTTDIEYSADNIHKVFINATIGNGIKGVVFTAATGNQYAVCSDGLLRMRTYSGSYSDWNVVALNTVIDDSNKNKNNRVPSIKAVVDYIASAISSKADTADVNAALATKANKTYVDNELGKKADVNHSHPVDSEFSQTSTNPVQNNTVTKKFNIVINNVNTALTGKANVNHTHDLSAYATNAALESGLAGKADVTHTHDNYVTLQAMIAALANKADISDIPTVPTNVSAFNNDAGYITSSDIDLSGKANYREVNIENINNTTNPNTVYRVSLGMKDGLPEYATIICPRSGDLSYLNHTQYAFTNLGRVLIRKCINGVWESSFTDLIPEDADVSGKADKSYVDTELAKKADKSEIPSKISAFTNDVGYLTQHQDISGKENTSNKKTSISNQSQTGDSDTNYPTVGAVRDFVNLVKDDLEDYVDDELSGKADESTTLAGYGITDSYTKSEVNSLVESGIVPDSAVVTAAVNNYLDNHPVDYSDEVSRTVDNIVEDLYSVENVSYESNDSILTLSNGYYNLNGEIVDHSAYKHTEKIKVIAGTTLQYSNLRAANNTLPCIACFANGVFSSALSYVPGNTDYASGTFQIPEGITAISLITREAANYPVSITIAEHKSRLTPLSEEVDSLEVISESLIAQKTIQLTSTDLSWESAYINKNGGITEHSKYHVSELISVIEGTTLNFQNLRAPASGYPYLACYTSNDRTGYVSSKSLIATDSGFKTGSLTVPQGIKYISVSIYDLISSSNPFLMEKDVSVNRVDELEDSLSKFGANHWSGKRWYAFGTSITDTNNSLGENGTPTGKYAPYLQQMSGMLLSNYGIAGGTIGSGGVHGGTSNILNKIKAADLSAADLITIEGFVNDFACSVPLGDIGDTENTSLYGALTQAVRHCLENSGATVVLITESIGRLYNEADYRTTRKNVINLTQNDYNEAIRNIGKFLGVPVIDAGGLAHINENRPKYLFDHIHHSELGGKQYANAIWSCLKNIPCSE